MDMDTLNAAGRKFEEAFWEWRRTGVCDSEGCAFLADWFARNVENRPSRKITFRTLQGFEESTPDDVKEACEAAIRAAAEEYLPVLCRARRAGLIDDVYGFLR